MEATYNKPLVECEWITNDAEEAKLIAVQCELAEVPFSTSVIRPNYYTAIYTIKAIEGGRPGVPWLLQQ